jgi:hypothetical protein
MINDFLNGKIFLRNIDNDYLSLSVMQNKDYDPIKKNNVEDGPLYYQYYLDIEPSGKTDFDTYLIHIKSLISFFKTKGFNPIAACKFEDKLNGDHQNI